ncbi:MAG: hypothetical protein ACF8R7_00180 [Phycisphaerales bacterium JB039]
MPASNRPKPDSPKLKPPMAPPAKAPARYSRPADSRALAKPRRVRAGLRVKLDPAAPEGAGHAAGRLLRLLELSANPAARAEGLEYGQSGQTRKLTIEPGAAVASIQGRSERPYETKMVFGALGSEEWDQVADVLNEQPRFAARLLAGEVPPDIEAVFEPLELRLFPRAAQDVEVACSCREKEPWCKHICCLGLLLAERLVSEPTLIFQLRGATIEDVLERTRQRRLLAGADQRPAPVYVPRVPGASDAVSRPLEESLADFWRSPAPADVDLSLRPPEVSHPLLRRLGPSPFEDGKFPLVGLLASCYEHISEVTLKGGAEEEEESSTDDTDGEED